MTTTTDQGHHNITQAMQGLRKKATLLSVVSLFGILGFLLAATPPAANAAACVPPATTLGTDTVSVSAPTNTTYSIWVRMQTPAAADNSVMLQLDGTTCYNVGGNASITPNTWTWVNYQNGSSAQVMQASLTAGAHSLEFIGTEPGVKVDNVLLLANPGCTPSGTGINCTTNQPAPTAPTLSGKAASSTSVSLNWTQSTDSSGLTVAGYYVYRGTTKIATITSPATLTYTDTVVAGSTNTYTVQAYDNSSPAVTSPASNAVPVTTVVTGLTAPTNAKATAASTSQVDLTWTGSTDVGGPGVAGYYILRNGTNIASVSSTTTSYSDKAVSAGTAYSYVIEAFDSNSPPNVSLASTPAQVTTPNAAPVLPTAPTTVKATATAYNSVSLSWTASTDTGGPGVAGYYIIRGGVTIAQVASPAVTYTDGSVNASTAYSYTIKAFDSNTLPDVSPASTAATVTTPSAPVTPKPPTAPANLTATAASSSQINLSWTASTATGGVAGYTIYRNGTQIATVTTTTYGDTGLSASTSYTYYVVASNAAGNSPHSNSVSATTKAATTSTTATVEGIVTNAKTKAPLAGVYVHTGIYGTTNGAATAYTNSAGQYVLSGITADTSHSYHYSDSGYNSATLRKSFPVGINTVNESLTPAITTSSITHHHRSRG